MFRTMSAHLHSTAPIEGNYLIKLFRQPQIILFAGAQFQGKQNGSSNDKQTLESTDEIIVDHARLCA